jgi:hypothetical protein
LTGIAVVALIVVIIIACACALSRTSRVCLLTRVRGDKCRVDTAH